MVGWHNHLNRHEPEEILGDSEGRKPGMLQSMGLQGVGHNLATEHQQQGNRRYPYKWT